MINNIEKSLSAALIDHRKSGLTEQVDYKKFYLYSVITHSTVIEGSTLTENETVKYAVGYVKSGNRYLWLRDSFNDLCNDTLPDAITDDKTIYRTIIGQEIINRCTSRIDNLKLNTLQKGMAAVMTEVNQGLKG